MLYLQDKTVILFADPVLTGIHCSDSSMTDEALFLRCELCYSDDLIRLVSFGG